MADTALFTQLDKLAGSLKPAQWQAYLRFQVGNTMEPYLGKAWRDADHAFRGRLLRGEDEPAPRWRQVLDAINASAGAMVAHEYVARHLPDANRERAARWTRLAAPLAAHPKLRDFRHRGMIWAFEVDTDRADFARWCFAEGLARELLLRPIGRTVYFMPPYVVTDAEFAALAERTREIVDAA